MELQINIKAHEKIQYWMHKTKKEISGLGLVQVVDGTPYVKDVILLEQENTAGDTEINGEAICKAMTQFLLSGQDGDIKFWWHSHVEMGCFWSGDDVKAMRDLSEHGWFCHAVFNKKGEYKAAFTDLSIPNPLKIDSHYRIWEDDIPLRITEYYSKEFYEKLDKDYDEKVTEAVYTYGWKDKWKDNQKSVGMGGTAKEAWEKTIDQPKSILSDASKHETFLAHFCMECRHLWKDDYTLVQTCPQCFSWDILDEMDLDAKSASDFGITDRLAAIKKK